jgi:hypothetical protein
MQVTVLNGRRCSSPPAPNIANEPSAGSRSLRRLLSRPGSYPLVVAAAAAASGQLPHFPVTLFEHVGDVYRRVETAADHNLAGLEELRLAALVHEEPQESLTKLLASAGVSDFAPTVVAVTGAFGRIWKVRTERDLRDYVEVNRPHLASILLFELGHEGQSTPEMERAAQVGGLQTALKCWAERLAGVAPPNLLVQRTAARRR